MESLYELFPRGLPKWISASTYHAQRLAQDSHHSEITINHLIYGMVCCIEENKNKGPKFNYLNFFIGSEDFKHRYGTFFASIPTIKDVNRISVSKDLSILIFYTYSYLEVIDSINDLYLLICYLHYCDVIKENFYLSINNKDKSYIEFKQKIEKTKIDEALNYYQDKNLINRELDFTKIISLYSSPIELEYTTDITNKAFQNKYLSLIGRTNEINKMINILCKHKKNNPMLIGNPGVGKTSLVYALARLIVMGAVNEKLQGAHIMEIDVASAVSGAKYRGDFEERIKNVFEKIKNMIKDGVKIILYIDEIHTIVSVGKAEGALSLAELLKPILAYGEIPIIGSTTLSEYRQVEKDKALARRFDTIRVSEPSNSDVIEILESHYSLQLLNHHKVRVEKDTIKTMVELSERYITNKFQPDKALDLLDTTCAMVSNSKGPNTLVTVDDVYNCISEMTEIPVQKVKDSTNLFNLENQFSSKVIGQTHVIKTLSSAIRRTKAGLNDENRPLLSALFVGPTGVGKTETAKALADIVFSGQDNIIRFDMSEYMEEHSITKLIGSPPGYVGYEESGLLTEKVKHNPYSLVLFDEFEKAHPRIYNLLLQILDEGRLTDSKGENINFKNTIIILTSNVGVSDISKPQVGFASNSSMDKDILPIVKKYFTPEFLNRIDEILQFNSLTIEEISKIAQLYIEKLVEKVNKQNIELKVSDDVVRNLIERGYSKEYGARQLRRTIDKYLKNPLADYILQNPDTTYIEVTLQDDSKYVFSEKVLVLI